MVVFFNDLTSFEDQLKWQQVFIEEIRKHLLQLQQEKPCKLKFEVQSSEEPNSRSLSFKLSSPELQQEVEFDVQPAYDALCKSESSRVQPALPSCMNPLFYFSVCDCVCWESMFSCMQMSVHMFACVGNGQTPALEVGYLRAYFG